MATGAAYQRRSVVNLGPIHAEAAPAEVVEGGASAAKGDGADGSAGGWVAPTSTYERIRSGSFSFLADNEFIHTGYRHGMTYKQAFVSLFQLHNETSNVLSHLIGAVVFLGLFIHVMSGGLQGDYAQKVVAGGRGIMRLAAGEIQAFKTYAGGKLGVEFGVVPPACTLTTVGDGATERVGCGPETDASADFRAAFAALRDSLGASAEALRAGAGARAESMWGEGAALAADLSLYATRAASEAEGVVDALVASGGQGRRAAGEKLTALLLPMMDKARRLGDLLDVEELGGAGGGASRVARDALTRVATGVSTAWHALERLGGLPQEAIDAIEAGTAAGGGGDRPHADRIPIFPLAIFAASALVCLGTSATFHLLHVVDRGAFEMLARADYTGIAILTAGSMYPPVVYGFLCSPGWTRVYLGITTLASAATGACRVRGARMWVESYAHP